MKHIVKGKDAFRFLNRRYDRLLPTELNFVPSLYHSRFWPFCRCIAYFKPIVNMKYYSFSTSSEAYIHNQPPASHVDQLLK